MDTSSVPYDQAVPTTARQGSDPETMLPTPLQTELLLTASSLNNSGIVWMCVLSHYPVVGRNWPQSSAVHRAWHAYMACSDSLPSSRSVLPCTNVPLYHHQSPLGPSHCLLHHAWQILLHLFLCSASHKCSSVWPENLKLGLIGLQHISPVFLCPVSVLFCPS